MKRGVVAVDKNFPGPDSNYVSTFGTGEPVTLFVHGFAGSIRDTRPFAQGIAGTRALMHLGGHGGRPSPGPHWTYGTIAAQVAQALAATAATHALGVSMGAGSLARLITQGHPAAACLTKVVFVLPASWDGFEAEHLRAAHEFTQAAQSLVQAGDRAALVDLLLSRENQAVRANPAAREFAALRADALIHTDLVDGLGLAERVAVDNPTVAANFSGEVLVLTHEDDPVHPVYIARKYHEAFPKSRLEVLPAGSILWTGRQRVREILTDFLNDSVA